MTFRTSRFRDHPLPWVMCLVWLTAVAGTAAPVRAQTQQQEHPLVPAIDLAKQSLQVLYRIEDYEATLIKREVINGRLVSQRIRMRLKEQPFSLYMRFEEPNAGREVLYVQGRNDNQMLVHEAAGLAALVGTVSLPLDSPRVMAENRHPLTDVGMRRLLQLLIQQWELESKYGEIDVKFYPNAKMGPADCEVIESLHPHPRRQFPFHITRLFLEKNSRLPIRLENYGFPPQPGQPPPLIEEYTYLNVRTNRGLTAADFDRRNQNYSFR